MTASTEQELQDFEAWAVEEGLHIDRHKYGCEERYASISTQSALRGWQAARRSPVVAVPQGWKLVPIEPTPEMYDRVMREGYYHDDPKAVKAVLRAEYQDMLAAAPQLPESACNPSMQPLPDLATNAATVPKFNHAAKRKLGLLQGDGASITGYAIEKDGRRGAIDCHGFVYWWNAAAPVHMPEPRWYNPLPGDAAHFPYYTPEDVRLLLAQHGIK